MSAEAANETRATRIFERHYGGSSQFFKAAAHHQPPSDTLISREDLREEKTQATDPSSPLVCATYESALEVDTTGNYHTAHCLAAEFSSPDSVFEFYDRLSATQLNGQIHFNGNQVSFKTSSTTARAKQNLAAFMRILNDFTPLENPSFAAPSQTRAPA